METKLKVSYSFILGLLNIGINPVKCMKGKLLGHLPTWGPDFCFSFQVKVFSWIDEIGSIFRIAGKEGNCCELGQRYPAIFTLPGSTNTIQITSGIGNNGNEHHDLVVPRGQWFQITISQRRDGLLYNFKVAIDGAHGGEFFEISNSNPQKYENVAVYAGDLYHMPADAEIRMLKLECN